MWGCIWITGIMGENKLLIRFSIGLRVFSMMICYVLIQECLSSQFPHLSVGFWMEDPSWQIRLSFVTRRTEQLWWVQRALKYQFSGPQKPPQWTLKKSNWLFLKDREYEFTDANLKCIQLFCFVGLTLSIFCKRCTKKLAAFMAYQSKCLETLNYF